MSMTNLLKSIMDNADLPVTNGMSKWRESGSPITEEALVTVFEVMEMDSLNNTRTSGANRIRPSLIGDGCHRKHLLSFMGVDKLTPQDGSLDVMSAGTWGHYRWQLAGLSAGWLKDIEVQVSYEPWQVNGAMDGLLSDGSGFELKTVNSFKFNKILKGNEPLTEHLMQTHAYMKALDLDYFSIVYENRDNAAWREFRVKRMEHVDTALEMLMNSLHRHINGRTLPPVLEECRNHTGAYKWCDWRETCPTAQWKEN